MARRPMILAQGTGPQGTPGTSTNVIPVNKPLGQQAITIHLDGSTKLDLVRDRQREHHAGPSRRPADHPVRQPRAGHGRAVLTATTDSRWPIITVELGPDRDVSSPISPACFPITTDQTVLPASGGPNAISSGAYFLPYDIPPFDLPTPLPLLGPTPFPGVPFNTILGVPPPTGQALPGATLPR